MELQLNLVVESKDNHKCFGMNMEMIDHGDHGIWSQFELSYNKSEQDPSDVCQTVVGSIVIFWGGGLCWSHNKCSGIKGSLFC